MRRLFVLANLHLLPPQLPKINLLRVLPISRKRNWSFHLKISRHNRLREILRTIK
ncbi:hypothetical protein R3W88_019062 [Solanum pinnatisectum]|uniref:Uncharacterized protein n=1 Tax=Solanum pinnatisectum TaxID=50273 RepID=A0AAV9KI97_9SOLN|nr:hypothetical protein R3W88_019062 [Solanum pinnatisectum]